MFIHYHSGFLTLPFCLHPDEGYYQSGRFQFEIDVPEAYNMVVSDPIISVWSVWVSLWWQHYWISHSNYKSEINIEALCLNLAIDLIYLSLLLILQSTVFLLLTFRRGSYSPAFYLCCSFQQHTLYLDVGACLNLCILLYTWVFY